MKRILFGVIANLLCWSTTANAEPYKPVPTFDNPPTTAIWLQCAATETKDSGQQVADILIVDPANNYMASFSETTRSVSLLSDLKIDAIWVAGTFFEGDDGYGGYSDRKEVHINRLDLDVFYLITTDNTAETYRGACRKLPALPVGGTQQF